MHDPWTTEIYLRAAAPAADPGTKHQERDFFPFSICFLINIMFQILEHNKSRETW